MGPLTTNNKMLHPSKYVEKRGVELWWSIFEEVR